MIPMQLVKLSHNNNSNNDNKVLDTFRYRNHAQEFYHSINDKLSHCLNS